VHVGEEVLAPVVQSLQNGAITELRISGLQLSNDASYELFFSNLRHSPISVLSLKFGVTEELVIIYDIIIAFICLCACIIHGYVYIYSQTCLQ
jgi:hypothetical protein